MCVLEDDDLLQESWVAFADQETEVHGLKCQEPLELEFGGCG